MSAPRPPRRLAPGLLAGLAIVAVAWAAGRSVGSRAARPLPRVADGSVEGCLACHGNVQGLPAPHDPATLGCSPCHLGDPAARDAERAHRGMEILSGDLSTVYKTCGRAGCHVVEASRVTTSLMARAPGILSVDRFAFGELPTPDGRPDGFQDLDGTKPPRSPAESHVRKLCGSCHLAVRKPNPGDLGFFSRGGGCAACHLAPPRLTGAPTGGRLHPDVSAAVSEQRCAGCHSRSGRIAMSYRGVVELEPGDPRVTGKLPDGRPTGAAPPDVHAKAGMTCVDCHTDRELMGDGEAHQHAHEALEIRCADCHSPGPRPPPGEDAARAAAVSRRAWDRRGMPPLLAGAPLRTSAGTELWRTDAATRSMALVTTGERRAIPPALERPYHALRGHERLSCEACHAQWAPRCTRCHTTLDPTARDVDHLMGVATPGHWIEEAGGNGSGPPLLAIGPRGQIDPFVEGMTFRLDGVGPAPIERALWAPLSPHTTGPSRTCASCHAAAALDATYPRAGGTTRATARLLEERERAAIARVGRCLGCHAAYDDRIYGDFTASLRLLSARGRGGRATALARCGGDPG
jgi:hypothetical protein